MTKSNLFVSILAGLALLVAGVAIGAYYGPRFETTLPTERWVSDRMAECGLTVRIHERAVETGDAALKQLILGDMVGCGVLVSWHPDKIPAQSVNTAERIREALGPNFAVR